MSTAAPTTSHIATAEITERTALCEDIEASGDQLDGFGRLTVAELRLFADIIAAAAGRRSFDAARHCHCHRQERAA